MDQTTLAGRILTPAGWVDRHPPLHRPDPGDRARPGAGGPVHRPGLRRPARPWRPWRRLHGGSRRGPPHGRVPRPPRHHLAARDHGDRPGGDLRRAMRGIADAMREPGPGRARPRRPSRGAVHQPARRWARSRRSRSRPTSRCWRSWRPPPRSGSPPTRPRSTRRASSWLAFPPPRHRAQIGHTTCNYAQARAALAAGAAGFTHLYNAMSGLHHREPGAVGAALAVGSLGRADPRLPACRRGRRTRGPARGAAPPLRHRRRGRRRHARRRVPPRHPRASSSAATPSASPTAASPAACSPWTGRCATCWRSARRRPRPRTGAPRRRRNTGGWRTGAASWRGRRRTWSC